jgi:nitroimidazol reductase NimA-like FMN-containing flavoprotein (pyridoxamine 5'-phosphate oxidase superfamily)
MEYASVVIFGHVTIETDPKVKTEVLARWFTKYAPHLKMGNDFKPFEDKDVARTTVYHLDIDEWSAKQNREPENFPGAYEFGKT